MFLFCLVMVLNADAFEVARLESLRAVATFYWMGCLLGGPDEPPASDDEAREEREAWTLWHSVVDRLALQARVRTAARALLEARYFEGRGVLFPDAAAAWAEYVEHVERIAHSAELFESVGLAGTDPSRRGQDKKPSDDEQAEVVAASLADDARVKAFELLGERERAVSIMERRLNDRGSDFPGPKSGTAEAGSR